jgi:ABC-type sulfate transport system permease subunit
MNGEAGACGMGGGGVLFLIIELVIALVMLIAMWKVFVKAGKPGWAILIPFYNAYVFLKIAGKPGWWLILLLVPGLNIIFGIIALAAFAQNFGKGAGFIAGLIFLPFIFYPILAFSEAHYIGAGDADSR